MPGHNTLSGLTQDQKGTSFDGSFITFGNGAPSNTTTLGIGLGGLYINLDSSSTATTIYINRGTSAVPVWAYMVISDI
tara:strand:- start:7055 stop:7288 length:234 start_codon:yes stop_codon:yes gene_type:complete